MDSLIALLGDELVFDFLLSQRVNPIILVVSIMTHQTMMSSAVQMINLDIKAKLRLRTYEDNSHYLELKQKYRGIVYKKRIRPQ